MSIREEIVATEIVVPAPADGRAHARAATLNRLLVYGVCALLMFGPLAFGATELWSRTLLQVGAALLLLAWVGKQAVAGRIKLRPNPLFFPILFFAGLVTVQLLFGATAYRYATYAEALRLLACAMVFFVVNHCFRTENDLGIFAIGFSVFGFAVAGFAIVHGFTDEAGRLYWIRVPRDLGWTYGPYVNHNHYAGLMEMLVPIPLVLAVRGEVTGGKRVIVALAAAVMAASIFLSGSRGGMVAFAAQAVFLALYLWRKRRGRMVALAMVVTLAVFAALVAGLGGSALLDRLGTFSATEKYSGGFRADIVRDSWTMWRERPLLGWGLGTFPDAYPRFRTFYTNYFVNHAHNDYLETLVDTGLLGGFAVLWFIVLLYRAAFRRLRAREYGMIGAMTLAALLGCTGLLVHSFSDFNLHIPANAALFFALCALATARLERSHRRGVVRPEPRRLFPDHRGEVLDA